MRQITMDDLIDNQSNGKLICCALTENYHWLRITQGQTPAAFKKEIHFTMHDCDYLYIGTETKDEILSMFDGEIKHVPFDFAKGV